MAHNKSMIPLLAFLCMLSVCQSVVVSNEAALHEALFPRYNRQCKPTVDAHTPLTVSIHFALARIESMNERDQTLTSFGWINAYWMDELLRWDPADYGGTERLTLEAQEIWLPEITPFNSAGDGYDIAYETKFRAVVYSNGMVNWAPGFKWVTSCDMDMTYFPYDEHRCNITFVNWMYGGELLKYEVLGSAVNTDAFLDSKEWTMVNSTVFTDAYVANMSGHIFVSPGVGFTLHLRRMPAYYLWNVLIPCVLMSFLSVLMYVTPAESGEKVGLAVTILLSFSVLLLMVSEVTPRNGDTMPLVTQYIVYSMGVTSVSLIFTLGVLNMHHHSADSPMARVLRRVLLHYLATGLLLHKPHICCCCSDAGEKPNAGEKPSAGEKPIAWAKPNAVFPAKDATTATGNRCQNCGSTVTTTANPADPVMLLQDAQEGRQDGGRQNQWIPDDLLAFVRKKMADDAEADEQERIKKQWEHAANVVDRFLLLLTLFAMCAMTMSYMLCF